MRPVALPYQMIRAGGGGCFTSQERIPGNSGGRARSQPPPADESYRARNFRRRRCRRRQTCPGVGLRAAATSTVLFDPGVISFHEVLEVFFAAPNSTQGRRMKIQVSITLGLADMGLQ